MRSCILVIVTLLVACVAVEAQVSVYVPDSIASGASCNLIPFNAAAPYNAWTYVARVPASFLGGAIGLRQLNEVWFAPCGTGAWTCSNVLIGMGHVPSPLSNPFSFPSGGSFGSFLDFTVLYDSSLSGALTLITSNNTWSPLGFAGFGGTSFCWDGTNDIAIFITAQGSTMTGWSGGCTQSTTEPARAFANSFNAATSTGSGAGGLKMRLDFVACGTAPALYETNDAASSLDFNGVQGTSYVPAVTGVCAGTPVRVNIGSMGIGMPWEAAYNLSPLVFPVYVTGGGQLVNIDLGAGVAFFFGGAGPGPVPFPGSTSLTFAGAAPGVFSIQQYNGNPAHPDGISLSQACQLQTTSSTLALPAAGPNCDDCSVTLNVGCINGLYGRTYQLLTIQSNGRVMFGGGSSTATPSVAQFIADWPSFGVWCDFNPLAGGTVAASAPTPGVIRIDYTGVVYYGTMTPSTFALIYDQTSGIATIDGLQGIASGTIPMLVGISGGGLVSATDPGPTAFSPAPAFGVASNGTDALYALGTAGSVTTGVNRILFVPNGLGSYDWISN